MTVAAKPKPSNRVSVVDLRSKTLKLRRRVQFNGETLPVYYYEDVIGYLMPIDKAKEFKISSDATVKITEFRTDITQWWERLQTDLDCVWLEYHDRLAMAFVSPKIYEVEQ